MTPTDLATHPIHLGLGATAIVQPAFNGDLDWYEAYGQRHADDGREGRLVAVHGFDAPWTAWEMHPAGDEVVVCLEGRITLWQQAEGADPTATMLEAGEFAINPPGVWHTADVDAHARALFITAGLGTRHRPR